MKNNNITINIEGKTNTGKSRLCFLLKQFLRENEFDVDFDGGVDFKDENEFDEHIGKNFDKIIEHIKPNTKITLKEVQSIKKKNKQLKDIQNEFK